MSFTPLPPSPLPPPPPPGKCTSGTYFFALPAMNGSSPAELKFRENTGILFQSVDSYSLVLDSNEFLSLSCQWSLNPRFRFFASRTSWIADCTRKKKTRVPESGFPYLAKREKESFILPAISAGPRNHPTTGIGTRRCTGDR